MDANKIVSNINKDKQQNNPDQDPTHHMTNVDGEELKRHVKELLDLRHKQLHEQVKTMMNEHIARLETVKRGMLLEYEQSKQDGDLNDESLGILLKREKGDDV
ncbi:uncharacterized protein PWA37_000450 [Arxiozyma heterogenica]|uniref:Uncharacterized protein n=1 Tax=Arxiozyma heterogenica TaxID=278026 RepID=A0AAN7WS04_9SACH|nr:hypothetical protein RI543_003962 [Kazachstania heterogenica]